MIGSSIVAMQSHCSCQFTEFTAGVLIFVLLVGIIAIFKTIWFVTHD